MNTTEQVLRNRFIKNLGQLDQPNIRFYGAIQGGHIWFSDNNIQLWLDAATDPVKIIFLGAQAVEPNGQDRLRSYTNFILGDRGAFKGVSEYDSVVYKDLWPNVSLIYRSTPEGPKYEFEINPGGNPEDIRLRYVGQDVLEVGTKSLIIQLDDMTIFDDGLFAFQENDEVPVSFELLSPDTIGFHVGEYNRELQLVIDPFIYSTFIGGSDSDVCRSVAVDRHGNAYVTGWTSSINFPLLDPFDSSLNSGDCFVLKLAPNGTTILYSTYIGGSAMDAGSSISVDSMGNVYVAGETFSPDFPVVSSYANSSGGEYDLFVLKLNPEGSSLIFSTYIGGEFDEGTPKLAIDDAGYVYVAASTESLDFPTVNAFNSNYTFHHDTILLKLNSTGNELLYSTYLGGQEIEFLETIALDDKGWIYVAGSTGSPNFPLVNPLIDTLEGFRSGYLSVFDTSLNATDTLVYSTYIGGSDFDYVKSLAIESTGLVVMTGGTFSPDMPVSGSLYDEYNGNGDGYVLRLNITENSVPYCTYIGGTGDDRSMALAIDASGSIFLAGITASTDFPTKGVEISSKQGQSTDIFVLRINAVGNDLLYSTLVGSPFVDWVDSVALGDASSVYVAGHTESSQFPTANGRFTEYRGGPYDGVLFKLPDLHDADEDGLSDLDEEHFGTDKYDNDSDDDLLLDGFEVEIGTNPMNHDSDSDQLDDYQEVILLGTNPLSPDSEGDEMPDGWEVQHGLNPLVNDSLGDMDLDGLLNLEEYLNGTDPVDSDSDNDAMPDGWEVENGLDPLNASDAQYDSDNDGLSNFQEYEHGTDPESIDSDFDSFPDGWEVHNGFDPLDNFVPINELLLYNSGFVLLAFGAIIAIGVVYFAHGRYLQALEEQRKRELERETQEAMDDLAAN
ncbi:MAG: DUF7948 domain-containing protein [Candidatus Thorarchaeota archaeon]